MRLVVFGHTGQVATELRALAARDGHALTALGRDQVDLADPAACAGLIRAMAPRAVINAAAYTAVDRAETEEALATTINAAAPAAMAAACAGMDIPFVHLSTDYVFAGTGAQPWQPDAPTAPCNAYGRSKLAGEVGVRAAGGRHVVLRTSWVFSAQGTNFARTILRLGQTRDQLGVVADQIGGPTPARAIAEACLVIAGRLAEDRSAAGTYHFAGTPDVSWHGFAEALLKHTGSGCALRAIPSAEYPTPALRPMNSRLDCSRTQQVFGLSRPDWRAAIPGIVAAMEVRP
jgi:dTDP-4-dehydrorhamnose reductase